jgi:hypothetical protein
MKLGTAFDIMNRSRKQESFPPEMVYLALAYVFRVHKGQAEVILRERKLRLAAEAEIVKLKQDIEHLQLELNRGSR